MCCRKIFYVNSLQPATVPHCLLNHAAGCAGVVFYSHGEVSSQDEIRSDAVMGMAAIVVSEMPSAEADGRGSGKAVCVWALLMFGVFCLAASFVDGCQQAAIFKLVIQKVARWYSGRVDECMTARSPEPLLHFSPCPPAYYDER